MYNTDLPGNVRELRAEWEGEAEVGKLMGLKLTNCQSPIVCITEYIDI